MWFFRWIYELILLNFVKETRKQYINSTVVLLLGSNKTAIPTTIINLYDVLEVSSRVHKESLKEAVSKREGCKSFKRL